MAGVRRGPQAFLAFNAGEWSGRLAGRQDVERARRACRTLENMVVQPYGIVRRRAGLRYIATVDPDAAPPPPVFVQNILWLIIDDQPDIQDHTPVVSVFSP